MRDLKQRNYENEIALIYIPRDWGYRVLWMLNKINKNLSTCQVGGRLWLIKGDKGARCGPRQTLRSHAALRNTEPPHWGYRPFLETTRKGGGNAMAYATWKPSVWARWLRLSKWDLYLAGWSEQAVCQLARPAKRQQDNLRGTFLGLLCPESGNTKRRQAFAATNAKIWVDRVLLLESIAGKKKKKQSREMSGIDFARLQRTIWIDVHTHTHTRRFAS